MQEEAKRRLEMIQSMLVKGHGFSVSPHSISLWGIVIGLYTIFVNYGFRFFNLSLNTWFALVVSSLFVTLALVGYIDHRLTQRWKAKLEQVMPLLQKQIMWLAWYCALLALLVQLMFFLVPSGRLAGSIFVFIASLVLVAVGIFSNRWYMWAGLVFALLNALLYSTVSFFPAQAQGLLLWFRISAFLVGFPVLQLLSVRKCSLSARIFSSLILSAAVCFSTFVGSKIHYYAVIMPESLPVYELTNNKPGNRYIVKFKIGDTLTAHMSLDRYSILPPNMPESTLVIKKNIEFVFEDNKFAHRFRIDGGPWSDRQPFNSYAFHQYAHVTTDDGLTFEFFWPYFSGSDCDCIAIQQ